MQAVIVGLLKTVGSVVWGMVVELVTARFIRKQVKRGLRWLADQSKTQKDDEIVEDAIQEWENQSSDES